LKATDAASRPDLVVAIYGALPDNDTAVPPGAPPVFVAAASDDVYPWSFSSATYSAWRAAGVSAELHIFEDGGHGFGMLHQRKSTDQWPGLLDTWLRSHRFASRHLE
jgi:acetyl esterase/lipase